MLAGGVAVPDGGVAGEPGVEVCPALREPPAGGAPPDGAVCASAQLPQHSTMNNNAKNNNANLDFNIKSPAFCSEPSSDLWHSATQVKVARTCALGVSGVCRRLDASNHGAGSHWPGRKTAHDSRHPQISDLSLNRVRKLASRGQGYIG